MAVPPQLDALLSLCSWMAASKAAHHIQHGLASVSQHDASSFPEPHEFTRVTDAMSVLVKWSSSDDRPKMPSLWSFRIRR